MTKTQHPKEPTTDFILISTHQAESAAAVVVIWKLFNL